MARQFHVLILKIVAGAMEFPSHMLLFSRLEHGTSISAKHTRYNHNVAVAVRH